MVMLQPSDSGPQCRRRPLALSGIPDLVSDSRETDEAATIVKFKVGSQLNHQFRYMAITPQVNILVLHTAPKLLHEDVMCALRRHDYSVGI